MKANGMTTPTTSTTLLRDIASSADVFMPPLEHPAEREYVFTGPRLFDADLSGAGYIDSPIPSNTRFGV